MDHIHPTIDTDYSEEFDNYWLRPYVYHMFFLGRDKLRKNFKVYSCSSDIHNHKISVVAYMIEALGLENCNYISTEKNSMLINADGSDMFSSICPFIEI